MSRLLGGYGVVVGRFQVDDLHEGHRYLLNEVQTRHSQMMIVIGDGPLPTTCRNPLPFETRKSIIQDLYPKAQIVRLEDHPNDFVWSQNLDKVIQSNFAGMYYTATLYCSRDGFAGYYTGRHPVEVLDAADLGVSATLRRQLIAESPGHTSEFARGVIWANHNKFPTVYSVVDMAVTTGDNYSEPTKLLVITKDHLTGYMLPGGFCDVGSESHEHDATRETEEETGIWIPHKDWKYIRSMRITDDWRYRSEVDEMRTNLFHASYRAVVPTLKAGDDAATAEFIPIKDLTPELFNPTHRPLFESVLDYLHISRPKKEEE